VQILYKYYELFEDFLLRPNLKNTTNFKLKIMEVSKKIKKEKKKTDILARIDD
jgi:hypothetical protein